MRTHRALVVRIVVVAVLAVLVGAPLVARQASPPILTATLSDTRLSAGETLSARVTVTNTGFGAIADFYFVILLPDGSTVVSAGPGVGARFGRFSDLRTLVPVAGGIGLGSPFAYQNDAFFEYTFTGSEPPGIYRVYFAALSAGALGDGTIGGGELIALATTEFTVAPALTTVPDPSRTSTATISTTGGQVATTASNGLAYSLAFPAGAVAAATTVSITPLVSAANVPGVGSFALGLRAEPSGLTFSTPATLSIALPTGMAVSPGGYAALISSDQGRRLEVVPIALADRTLTVRVPHFSDVVVTSNFLGICGIPNQSAEMIEACRQLAAALDLAGGSVEDPNFKALALDLGLSRWFENGLRARLNRLTDDEPPAGQNKDTYLDAVTQEWTAWAAIYSVVAGPIRVHDSTKPLATMIQSAFGDMSFGTKFGQDRANARCLADKPFARVHVQRVSGLEFRFQSTFDEPNPFETEYCLGLVIDAAPVPVLTPGTPATMPLTVRLRFTDNVEMTGVQGLLTITATSATVTPAGGVVTLPFVQNVRVTPTTTTSVITITAAADPVVFNRLPTATRTVHAGAGAGTIAATQLLLRDPLTEIDERYNDAAPSVAVGQVHRIVGEQRTVGEPGITVAARRSVGTDGRSMQLTGSIDRMESVTTQDQVGVFSESNIVLDLQTTTTYRVAVNYDLHRREGSGSLSARFIVSSAGILDIVESLAPGETARNDSYFRTVTLPPGVHGVTLHISQIRGAMRDTQNHASTAQMTLTRISGTP